MDIQLADGFRFDIFPPTQISCPVIFVTAYDQYAIDIFRVNGLDYLLKPVEKELLAEYLNRFDQQALQQQPIKTLQTLSAIISECKGAFSKERFLIKSGDELLFVKTTEIAYFLSESGYSFVVTKSGNRYIIDETMDQVEQQLNPKEFF